MTTRLRLYLVVCCLYSAYARCSDWPQFLGPTRNGVYPGNDLAVSWPAEGPKVVWQRAVGAGFSGPAVAANKLILFHRVKNRETVESLDTQTGKSTWSFDYPTVYRDDFGFDEGPRATPSIAGGCVYTYGAEGMLHCLDFATGKKLWGVDAKKDFHAAKGFFGIACSPLVEGNAIILNIGDAEDGAGIVAFDKTTGKVLWKATSEEASYSSGVASSLNGHRYAFFFTQSGLVALDPADGKVQFDFPWKPPIHESVSTATPLVIDDFIFLSASYGTGAVLLQVKDNKPTPVWSGDDILSNHYMTCVCHEGFLYGVDGRTDPGMHPTLRCVELKSGKVRWDEPSVGAATITLAGDHLIILTERGELIRAAASPSGFKAEQRAQVFPFQVRAYPALADGYLFARNKDKLYCLDLGKRSN